MYCPLPTIHDDLETLRTRLRQTRDAEQKQRLYLLVLIGEGRVKSRREAADYLAVHRNSIGRWLACYEREGLEGLLQVGAGGAPAEQRTLLSVLGRVPETPQPLRLFCQDESRISLHLPAGRRLTLPGVKPLKVRAPLYQYYWLYAAVEPTTGTACWLELPRLDSTFFQVFLDHFSRPYADSLNLLVLDNAPAHVAKALVIPANVVLIYLPPYCPELTPIERLWQDLKGRLAGLAATVRGSLSAVREAVEGFIHAYSPQQLASLTGYAYLCNVDLH